MVKKTDPLDALAEGDPRNVIALMLWVNRHRNPDMFVQIPEAELAKYAACMEFQKVKPTVMIRHPAEIPASPAIPAAGKRRAIPARPSIPARPYVMVALVSLDENGRPTENMIKPIENNEADYDTSQTVSALRRAKDAAPSLADRLLKAAASGEYSLSDMQDAADALVMLARAV